MASDFKRDNLTRARLLLNAPLDSPHWFASDGEEYRWIDNADYLVTNERVPGGRIRSLFERIEDVTV